MSRKFAFIALALFCLAVIYTAPIIATECSGIPGDVNNDGLVIGGDVTYLVNFLGRGGPPPPCMDQADANGDCYVTFADVTYLVNYFRGIGPAPKFCTD